MLRLGLRLTLRSGREALVRLVITAAAVAAGVALLLGVLAEFHAFQANANQPCWSCTTGASVPSALPVSGDLWNVSADFYQGQTITRLDVAPLGPNAPVPPGISRLPAPGMYDASPALERLLRTVPAGQLGARFPGTLAGTIGDAALNGANDLVIYVGYTPRELATVPGARWVTSIATVPAPEVFTPFFRYAFGAGVLAMLFPMLVLISTATRLAARREERLAALRLVGGTPGDIRVLAAVESVVGAFFGAALGIVIFLLVKPLLAGATPIGTQYVSSEVTPTLWAYVAMLAGVPVVAALAALISLRRVQVSPLGVSRRATPKPPTAWRLATLVIGVALYAGGLAITTHKSIGASAYPGLLVTMAGLVLAGPYLTAVAARLFGRLTRGPSALLAARRLADSPKTAFRSVTGLVLAGANSPAVLERVRTFLATHAPPNVPTGPGSSPVPPRTFGETLDIRLGRAATVEKIVYAAVALTLIVAGCSLAVAVGGGLVDRKRPFTLLRVSGTQVGVLSKVVLLEAAVPLVAATVVAAAIAYGTSLLAFDRLAPAGTAIPQLGNDYYALMGTGLVIACGIITVTLPLLRRMTSAGNVRFE